MIYEGKITSKGQTTIPKEIRQKLNLKAGDKISWSLEGERVVFRAKNKSITDLAGMLYRPGQKAATIEEMNDAIAEAAVKSALGE